MKKITNDVEADAIFKKDIQVIGRISESTYKFIDKLEKYSPGMLNYTYIYKTHSVGSNSNYAYYNISFGDGYEQDVKEEYSWKDFNYINSDIIDAINKSNEQ